MIQMHKYCTYVVKLLLSQNIQHMRGMYLLSQNILGVYFGICEKMPATPAVSLTDSVLKKKNPKHLYFW